MRQIEEQMVDAIENGRNWQSGNTGVRIHPSNYAHWADVYLHGNHIAEVFCGASGHRTVDVNVDTLAEYPTRTTMSRLRALGADVCTRKGKVYLNDREVS